MHLSFLASNEVFRFQFHNLGVGFHSAMPTLSGPLEPTLLLGGVGEVEEGVSLGRVHVSALLYHKQQQSDLCTSRAEPGHLCSPIHSQ